MIHTALGECVPSLVISRSRVDSSSSANLTDPPETLVHRARRVKPLPFVMSCSGVGERYDDQEGPGAAAPRGEEAGPQHAPCHSEPASARHSSRATWDRTI